MAQTQQGIFREQSLERLANPEQLDQLMQVVTVRSWIPLGTAGVAVAAILAWSVFGRIPVVVQGRGAFVDPAVSQSAHSVVRDVQAPGSGVLKRFGVSRGDVVKAGQLLGEIEQPELTAQLAEAEAKLADQTTRANDLDPLRRDRSAMSQTALKAEQLEAGESLRHAQTLTPLLRQRATEAIRSERQALGLRLKHAGELVATLKRTLETRKALRDQGLVTDSAFQSVQRDYLAGVEEVAALETQRRALDAREAENQKGYMANLSEIAALKSRLKSLEAQARTGELEEQSARLSSQDDHGEALRRVALLRSQLKAASEIRAGAGGHILEITAVVGEAVARGARLARIDIDDDDTDAGPTLRVASVCYMTIGDGMRVKPGMKVQVTPDTVTREEFGGILGRVTRVSSYPVSTEGALNVVNSHAIAEQLTADGHVMEVFAELELDPSTATGYRWSSSHGPDVHLTIGTTCRVRVTLEERAPITYMLPFLRGLGGAKR